MKSHPIKYLRMLIQNTRNHGSSLIALFCIFSLNSQAQDKYQTALDAVVNLQVEVPADARLSPVLGTFREGSGIVVDNDGLILTIGYLILEASDVLITTSDGQETSATIVAYDYDTGFGLVRADESLGIKPVTLGKSSQITSSTASSIVSFLGAPDTQSVDIVDVRLFPGFWEYLLEDAIFTAPIVRNFAGGALIDETGALVGIGSLALADAKQGLDQTPGNMFVPIDALKPILQELIEYGRRKGPARPWLGIYTEMDRGHLFVTRLAEDGPGEKSGVLADDIIANVNGMVVKNMIDFFTSIWSAGDAGIEIELDVIRNGKKKTIKVKTEDRYLWLKLNPLSKYITSL